MTCFLDTGFIFQIKDPRNDTIMVLKCRRREWDGGWYCLGVLSHNIAHISPSETQKRWQHSFACVTKLVCCDESHRNWHIHIYSLLPPGIASFYLKRASRGHDLLGELQRNRIHGKMSMAFWSVAFCSGSAKHAISLNLFWYDWENMLNLNIITSLFKQVLIPPSVYLVKISLLS